MFSFFKGTQLPPEGTTDVFKSEVKYAEKPRVVETSPDYFIPNGNEMVLLSVVAHTYKDNAWKSLAHSDGDMLEGYVIIGINTPKGQFTWYVKEMYWSSYQVEILEKAPAYDGHKENDITRLHSLVKKEET